MSVEAIREKIIIEASPHLKNLNGQKIANRAVNAARDAISELEARPRTTDMKMRIIPSNPPLQIEQAEEISELDELKSKNSSLKEENARLKKELENLKKGVKPVIAHYSDSDDEKFSDPELNQMYQKNKEEMCELRKSIRGLALQGTEEQLRVKQLPKMKQNEYDYAEEL